MPSNDLSRPRLIERAFPLKQTSLDSVHEKNVRHGHISTLHIWPARRPLAASRAALIATLLPDPVEDAERDEWLAKLGGTIIKATKKLRLSNGTLEERTVDETEGGILHWGRETGPDLAWFRDKIRTVYGRAPRVLDPFAGGGAIPLEAMRLGCDVTASDLNPVAWFLLKCTLEYPQALAGQSRPLPEFVFRDRDYMTALLKSRGIVGARLAGLLDTLGFGGEDSTKPLPNLLPDAVPRDADLAWHVRAWGAWVLARARADLADYYPTLNAQPTVAYLWARTVPCKNCRATLPLLKTRWLCKKDKKRVLLLMEPNRDKSGVTFDIRADVPAIGGGPAKKREHDKKIGAGTMSRSGATCPCCGTVMEMKDIRAEGLAGRLGSQMTAVVVDNPPPRDENGKRKPGRVASGKSYRLPTPAETTAAKVAADALPAIFGEIPFGLPTEPIPTGSSRVGGGSAFTAPLYGLDRWDKLFTPRQLLALGTFVLHTRAVKDEMTRAGYPPKWVEAVSGYLALTVDRLADYSSTVCSWHMGAEKLRNTFTRFALPIVWDFTEAVPQSESTGGYEGAVDWISKYVEHALAAVTKHAGVKAEIRSATEAKAGATYDAIVTDPPYYDAIPYSDLMDFFYVWLRRTLHGLTPEMDAAFCEPLAPKWNHETGDGELIDDAARFGGDKNESKRVYEAGMARAFGACHDALTPDGRLVIVFAHKQPDAWETLVTAIIRAGFVVDASWPIQTEMGNRTRAQGSAALSSSVWLVCRKRPDDARPGWDNLVLDEMRAKITGRLREYWTADITGPDFVWAATGPAMEAYSKYPVVKRANEPGKFLSVPDFLRAVRRMVVDFAVTHALKSFGGDEADELDDVTTYYLLHRKEFGLADTPAGACSLYAVSCGLSETDLVKWDILQRTGGRIAPDPEDDPEDTLGDDIEADADDGGTGSLMRLKAWNKRTSPRLGYDTALDSYTAKQKAAAPSLFTNEESGGPDAPRARTIPLVDQAHRLMQIWETTQSEGAIHEYFEQRGLRNNPVFGKVLQALIELAGEDNQERRLLENISNALTRARNQSASLL